MSENEWTKILGWPGYRVSFAKNERAMQNPLYATSFGCAGGRLRGLRLDLRCLRRFAILRCLRSYAYGCHWVILLSLSGCIWHNVARLRRSCQVQRGLAANRLPPTHEIAVTGEATDRSAFFLSHAAR